MRSFAFVIGFVVSFLVDVAFQPEPPAVPGPAPTEQVPASPDPEVYAFFSASGWARTWADYNNNASFVPGFRPGNPDLRYYYSTIATTCRQMGVAGVVITTPDISQPRYPDPIRHWRFRMEGRQDALNEGAIGISDRQAIIDGMVLLRQSVRRIVLYAGFPNDVSPLDTEMNDGQNHNYLSRDTGACDGYVRCNLGPWLDSGMVECVIIDAAGNSYYKPACAAVIKSIRRLYPNVRIGAEGHPMAISSPEFAVQPFKCSATTYTSAETDQSPLKVHWMVPITPEFWPVLVEFTEPHGFVPSAPNYHPTRYDDALRWIRDGKSVAIQDWVVGYPNPTPENRLAWENFKRQAAELKAQRHRSGRRDNQPRRRRYDLGRWRTPPTTLSTGTPRSRTTAPSSSCRATTRTTG